MAEDRNLKPDIQNTQEPAIQPEIRQETQPETQPAAQAGAEQAENSAQAGGQPTAQTSRTGRQDAAQKRRQRKHRSPMRSAQRLALHTILIVIVLYIMFGFIFGILIAPNNDMYPRIDARDMLLYYRLDTDVKAQDIIVLEKNKTTYVGRVVAVAGDEVEITDEESLVVNGSTMIESNIFYRTPRYEGFVQYPLKLQAGQCFVLVDSRSNGEDSRYYGPVNENEIKGSVITIVRRNNL